MKRVEVTPEHLQWVQQHLSTNELTEIELGDLFKKTFPGVFSDSTLSRNVAYRLKQKMRDQGITWAPQTTGYKLDRPATRWLDDNPELVIQYQPKVAIVSDLHAGAHDPNVVEFIAGVLENRGINVLVWGGDIFDNAYLGHRGVYDHYASTLEEVLFGAAQCFDRFTKAGVETHYFYCGNHDDKPMRGTQGEWSFKNFIEDKFLPQVQPQGKVRIHVTNRYYMTMRPRKSKGWPWTGPENFPWRFTHQKEYSRIPLSTASRLATKLWMNIACNHQHHLGWTLHPSGHVYIADTGCAQLRGAAPYKHRRDSTHPEHINGFLTIEDGRPHAWHYVGTN